MLPGNRSPGGLLEFVEKEYVHGKNLGLSTKGREPVLRIKSIIEKALFGGKENRAFLVKFACCGREPQGQGSVRPLWQERGGRHGLETCQANG